MVNIILDEVKRRKKIKRMDFLSSQVNHLYQLADEAASSGDIETSKIHMADARKCIDELIGMNPK